jgi:chromosome partitioning protein
MTTHSAANPAPENPGAKPVTAVANQKGGVGKSTVSGNLAAAEVVDIAEANDVAPEEISGEILVIEMDDQCDLSRSLGIRPNTDPKVERSLDPAKHGVIALLLDDDFDPFDAVQRTRWGVDVIPGHPELHRLDESLAGVMAKERILAGIVAKLRKRYRIYIDTPGSLGMATINAIVAAGEAAEEDGGGEILTPVCPGQFELDGFQRLNETIAKIATAFRLRNLGIPLSNELRCANHILLTDFDRRETIARSTEDSLGERFPKALLDTRIPRSVRVREAPGYGEPMRLGTRPLRRGPLPATGRYLPGRVRHRAGPDRDGTSQSGRVAGRVRPGRTRPHRFGGDLGAAAGTRRLRGRPGPPPLPADRTGKRQGTAAPVAPPTGVPVNLSTPDGPGLPAHAAAERRPTMPGRPTGRPRRSGSACPRPPTWSR